MLVLFGQIEHEEPLSWDVEHMNAHKVVEDQPCGRVLDAVAFLVWKSRRVLVERAKHAKRRLIVRREYGGHRWVGSQNAPGFVAPRSPPVANEMLRRA